MSYKIDGTDLVISGWEQGISDNPQTGINDMRAVNIISVPGEVSVAFNQSAKSLPLCTATITSADSGTDIVSATILTGSIQTYQAVTFTGSLPSPLVANTTYWISYQSSSTFKVYTSLYNLANASPIHILGTGTGSMATINMGEVKFFEKYAGVALDANGRAWTTNYGASPYYTYMGNPYLGASGTAIPTVGNGIFWYKGYLFVLYGSRICYLKYSDPASYDSSSWVSEWDPNLGLSMNSTSGIQYITVTAPGTGYHVGDTLTITQGGASGGTFYVDSINGSSGVLTYHITAIGSSYSTATGLATTVAPAGGTGCVVTISTVGPVNVFNTFSTTSLPHEAYLSRNLDKVYITDSNYVDSLGTAINTTTGLPYTFDPANKQTYIWQGYNNYTSTNNGALTLPSDDSAICLEELGNYLLIGGTQNVIYPWDKVSTGYNTVIKIADNYSYHLLTVNTNTYIFCGRRGRIEVTSGSQANFYKKIPDHILGIEPEITWGNCCYNKNQIYFGVTGRTNALAASTAYAGLWAIDITTDALRCVALQSTPTASVTAIYASNSTTSGFGLSVAWKTSSTYGIDTTTQDPYNSYVTYVETDLIPVGQFLKKRTFDNIEWKTSVPLVNGEGIKIYYRASKSNSYVQIGETLATASSTPFSDFYTLNFDQAQWAQFKVMMKSTVSSPSYCRLTELRLRNSSEE